MKILHMVIQVQLMNKSFQLQNQQMLMISSQSFLKVMRLKLETKGRNYRVVKSKGLQLQESCSRIQNCCYLMKPLVH